MTIAAPKPVSQRPQRLGTKRLSRSQRGWGPYVPPSTPQGAGPLSAIMEQAPLMAVRGVASGAKLRQFLGGSVKGGVGRRHAGVNGDLQQHLLQISRFEFAG